MATLHRGLDPGEVLPAMQAGSLGLQSPGRSDPWRSDGKPWRKPIAAAAQERALTLGIELLRARDIAAPSRGSEVCADRVNRGVFHSDAPLCVCRQRGPVSQ